MKQSKNSKFKTKKKKISLDDFILFCIEETIKESYNGGNLWNVDEKIIKNYGFEIKSAARMYSPVFHYMACSSQEKPFPLIKCDYRIGKEVWKATEKAKKLSLKEKEKIAKEIIKKNKDYFKTVLDKFNLDTLLL